MLPEPMHKPTTRVLRPIWVKYTRSPYGVLYRDEEAKLLEKYPYNQSAINPLWGVNDGTRENSDIRDNFRFNSTIVIRAPGIKGLSYRMNLMLNWEKNTQKNFTHETYYVKEGEYDDASRYSQDAYQSLLSKANGNIQITKISSWVMDHIINYNRQFNSNIVSIFDKRYSREMVKNGGAIRLILFPENKSYEWPAWEILKETIDSTPTTIDGNVRISIDELGPVRASLRVEKTYGESSFVQIISLTDGAQDDRIDIRNEMDWREPHALLKAEFPLTGANTEATYDLGIGSVRRGNNTETALRGLRTAMGRPDGFR